VELLVDQPFCPGDPGRIEIVSVNDDQPLIYSIDGGASYFLRPVFEGLMPGIFDIAVQDDLGCVRELSAEIIRPDTLGVALNLDRLEVRPGTPVSLNATTVGNISFYQWLPGEIDSGEAATAFVANNNMDIRLIVEDDRGCRASTGFPLTIVLGDIYIPNVFSPNQDGFNDHFTFYSDNGSGEIIELLQIYDRWGSLLFETTEVSLSEESQGWDGDLGHRRLNSGVYTYYGIVRFGDGTRKRFEGSVTLLR